MPGATDPATHAPPARAGHPPDVTPHLGWARGIARGVARRYALPPGSQEERDLEQTAYLALLRCARAFDAERVPAGGDPGGQLRGYAHRDVQSECRREARRLKNGGTYRTRREQGRDPVLVEVASDPRTPDGDRFDVPARAGGAPDPDPPDPAWSVYCTDPD